MKSTLKRELKGLEIVEGEGNGSRCAARFYGNLTVVPSTRVAGQRGLGERYKLECRFPDWRWRKGTFSPVLKHGPRSLTCMRVGGWKTRRRK